jgi:hypothetical protein
LLPWVCEREFINLLISSKKTTIGRILCCYIICNESLVEVDRLVVEVEEIDSNSKVEVVQPGKVKVGDIDNKSKSKILTTSRRGEPKIG